MGRYWACSLIKLLSLVAPISTYTIRRGISVPANQLGAPDNSSNILPDPEIINCDAQQTAALNGLVRQLPGFLVPAILDVEKGVKSTHGYTALFKSDGQMKTVKSVLTRASELAPPPQPWWKPAANKPAPFVCVTEDVSRKYPQFGPGLWEDCSKPGITGFTLELDFPTIFFCEEYFSIPQLPPKDAPCLTVKDNTLQGLLYSLIGNQVSFLFHELVHVYLGRSSLTVHTNPQEQYSKLGIVSLNAKNSAQNPMNYQLFVASVNYNCVAFPDPFSPPYSVKNDAPNLASLSDDNETSSTGPFIVF